MPDFRRVFAGKPQFELRNVIKGLLGYRKRARTVVTPGEQLDQSLGELSYPSSTSMTTTNRRPPIGDVRCG